MTAFAGLTRALPAGHPFTWCVCFACAEPLRAGSRYGCCHFELRDGAYADLPGCEACILIAATVLGADVVLPEVPPHARDD